MNLELIWLIVPICGLLSQIGGTFWKGARRFGIPLVMAIAYWYFKGFSLLLIPFIVCQWGAFCLPVTLKGDSIPKNPINWLWLPLWGVLICLPTLILHPNVWGVAVILGLILGIFPILSNIRSTAKWFPWKLCEIFTGMCPAIVLCFAV